MFKPDITIEQQHPTPEGETFYNTLEPAFNIGGTTHWHCSQCYRQDYMFFNWKKICKYCYENDQGYKEMLLCTPFICASS